MPTRNACCSVCSHRSTRAIGIASAAGAAEQEDAGEHHVRRGLFNWRTRLASIAYSPPLGSVPGSMTPRRLCTPRALAWRILCWKHRVSGAWFNCGGDGGLTSERDGTRWAPLLPVANRLASNSCSLALQLCRLCSLPAGGVSLPALLRITYLYRWRLYLLLRLRWLHRVPAVSRL